MKIYGVEAGPGFIRAAVVDKTLRGAKTTRLVEVALEPDERNSSSLKEFMARLDYNPDKDMLAAVFPGDKVTLRAMTTPLTKRSQIVDTLPFELESKVPLAADEFVCDFLFSGKAESGSRILAVLAKNEDVESFLSIYKDAELDPDILVPGPLAAAAAAAAEYARGEGQTAGTMAVVNWAPEGIYIALVGEDRTPLIFHTSSVAGEGEQEIAREIDKLALGLNREMPGLKLASIALGGGFGHIGQLARGLGEKLGIPAAPARMENMPEPEGQASPHASSDEKKALFLVASGAALMGADAAPKINLRSGPLEKVEKYAGMNREKTVAAGLLAATFVLWVLAFIGQGIVMDREYASLKSQTRRIFKEAMPHTINIVSEKQQMMAELKRLEEAAKALGVYQGRDPLLDILLEVSNAGPEDAKLDIENYTYEPGRLILTGRTESFDKVDQFKSNLDKLPWVGKARLDKAKSNVAKSGVSFRIEVDMAF